VGGKRKTKKVVCPGARKGVVREINDTGGHQVVGWRRGTKRGKGKKKKGLVERVPRTQGGKKDPY